MPAITHERKEDPVTIEQFWEMFQESSREFDRRIKETGLQMKETDKRIGFLSNRFGEIVEYLIVPSLVAKFKELNYTLLVFMR